VNVPAKPAIEVETHGNYVSGREIEAGDGQWIDVRNPASGAIIARIPHSTPADVDRAMKSARAAFESSEWGGLNGSVSFRATIFDGIGGSGKALKRIA
jgi:acyl-CoA reductase-like NAD-dependent aldehyde dehydrogenase